MGLFTDGFKLLKKASEPLYKTPKSIQETIEIMAVAENGIFEVSKNKYSNYILQKDPTQQTKGKMLFGEYRIVKLSKKTLKSTPVMNSDGHTIDGYKHPVFCGDLKEAITLFDRNVLTIDLNDKGAGLWDKDMTGLKVRDRFDVQAVDKDAVIKGEITEVVNG